MLDFEIKIIDRALLGPAGTVAAIVAVGHRYYTITAPVEAGGKTIVTDDEGVTRVWTDGDVTCPEEVCAAIAVALTGSVEDIGF